jgi:hypothetical protein
MYKLRADVAIADSGLSVVRGLGDAEDGTFADPRHPALGWRSYGGPGGSPPSTGTRSAWRPACRKRGSS